MVPYLNYCPDEKNPILMILNGTKNICAGVDIGSDAVCELDEGDCCRHLFCQLRHHFFHFWYFLCFENKCSSWVVNIQIICNFDLYYKKNICLFFDMTFEQSRWLYQKSAYFGSSRKVFFNSLPKWQIFGLISVTWKSNSKYTLPNSIKSHTYLLFFSLI